MIKKLFLSISLLFLFSCSNKKTEYDTNGNKTKEYELINNKISGVCKEFYKNGDLKAIHNYKNGIRMDSSIYYNNKEEIVLIDKYLKNNILYQKEFNNNVLMSEGKCSYKTQLDQYLYVNQIDKWKYYKKNGKLDKVIEYINLCGKQHTNQGWYFDNKGDTIKKYGNYFEIKFLPKNFKKKEVVCLQMIYKPIIYLNSDVMLCFDTENKVSEDFCNIHKVKLAKIYKTSNVLKTYVIFEKSGQKNIRGYIKEFFNKEPTEQDSITSGERYLYFDIPIKVE